MKKILAVIFIGLFVINCASVNPYGVAEGQGAYLENTAEQAGMVFPQ